MSLDPLAMEFAAWSDYNYVLGNPIMLVDPSGRSPEEGSEEGGEGEEPFSPLNSWRVYS